MKNNFFKKNYMPLVVIGLSVMCLFSHESFAVPVSAKVDPYLKALIKNFDQAASDVGGFMVTNARKVIGILEDLNESNADVRVKELSGKTDAISALHEDDIKPLYDSVIKFIEKLKLKVSVNPKDNSKTSLTPYFGKDSGKDLSDFMNQFDILKNFLVNRAGFSDADVVVFKDFKKHVLGLQEVAFAQEQHVKRLTKEVAAMEEEIKSLKKQVVLKEADLKAKKKALSAAKNG